MAKDLERFNKAMKDVQEDSDWDDATTKAMHGSDESEYSDWDGLGEEEEDGESTPSGILKKKQFFEAEDDEEEDATVVIESMEEANANFVFPEKSVAVLKESLHKASFAAKQASIYGYPAPSVYRDEDDEREEEVSFGPKKGKADKPKQKKRKFRYLTKTERKTNVSKERGRSKEKRIRGSSK